MLKKNEWDLILRHLAGESSADEKRQIELWLVKNRSNREQYETIKNIWECSLKKEDWNTESEWQRLYDTVNKYDDKNVESLQQIFPIPQVSKNEFGKTKISPYIYHTLRIAAVLLIMVGGYFILQQSRIFDNKTKAEITWNEKSTVMGEKFVIALSEGTKITLNADSKLKYPIRFNNNSREVYLEGEAYFEVKHDSGRPFIVHSGKISTTVLGTKFNVNAFPEEKRITVSLVEGKVKVSKEKEGNAEGIVELQPKQQLVYNKQMEISKVEEFDQQETTGWKDNKLIFRKESFVNVLVKLERAYGVRFELADKSFSSKKITANFQNESLWTVSETLRKLTGLQYKSIKENNETKKIIFYKK